MKISLLVSFLSVLFFTGCAKQETGCMPVEPQTEEPKIIAYAAADTIHAIKHSSGIYYEIINPGTGSAPTVNSTVFVTYTGKLLNGTKFDESTTTINFPLNRVIEGWQIGIPLIKKGGRIKLIIPSAYAYGCNGTQGIPPNSVLFFDVSLVDVK